MVPLLVQGVVAAVAVATGCGHCPPVNAHHHGGHRHRHNHNHGPAPSADLVLAAGTHAGTAAGAGGGVAPAVPFAAQAPVANVTLAPNGTQFLPVMEANADYLLRAFDVDHLLRDFRLRAGLPWLGHRQLAQARVLLCFLGETSETEGWFHRNCRAETCLSMGTGSA